MVERPIRNLPMFTDRLNERPGFGRKVAPMRVPKENAAIGLSAVHDNDPLPDIRMQVTDTLRYALPEVRRTDGGPAVDPTATVELSRTDDSDVRSFDLRFGSCGSPALMVPSKCDGSLMKVKSTPCFRFARAGSWLMVCPIH